MAVHAINQSGWPEFLRNFCARHQTWLVDVDSFREPAGQPGQVARDLHLEDILVQNGTEAPTIRVALRRSDQQDIVHQIFSPSAVRVIDTGDGRQQELEIQGANAATVIRFHSGAEHRLPE